MRQHSRELMARLIADWCHQGIIDRRTQARLSDRYDRKGSMFSDLLKWLGIFAIMNLALGVLALIALFADAELVASVLLGALSVGLWFLGSRMATDPSRANPITGSVFLTVGLVGGFAALFLFYLGSGGSDAWSVIPPLMLVTAAASIFTAYHFYLRWPLLMGLLFFFHGMGTWAAYAGSGTYLLAIKDPRLMSLLGLLSVVFGLWHGRALEPEELPRATGFGNLYVVFGLLYLNLSLLILSIGKDATFWVLALTAITICEIVAGARFHDRHLTGFGVVFLAIDIYTRYFEHFWNELSAGSLFLISGLIGLAIGYGLERFAPDAQKR